MFHPELAARARWLPRGVVRPWSVSVIRFFGRLAGALTARGREQAALDHCSVFVYRPRSTSPEPRPGLVWLHGGGLVIGDARQDEFLLRRLSDELDVVIVAVQYRKAPEHPFPAPLDDCEAGFHWLAAQPDVDPTRLAVAGVSAGGGLAAALCQRLRDQGGVQPVFQLLIYPMLDDRSAQGTGPSDDWHRVWDRRANAYGWGSYLAGHDPSVPPPHAVPGRTGDLSGLPPAWIGVGTVDLFFDEDRDYAHRLEAAGVPVELHLVDGGYHGFDQVDPDKPVVRAFLESQLNALRTCLHPRRAAL